MIDILSVYERFSFSILSCDLITARQTIIAQAKVWDRDLIVDHPTVRDVRSVLNSPDGPAQLPSIKTGILLSEVKGPDGPRTLFVSNVADGYSSMIYMLSRRVPGFHFLFQVSNKCLQYPKQSFSVFELGENIRSVYVLKDTNKWHFFSKGYPLEFEHLTNYDFPRKRDRLTPEILSSYLERLGYGSLCSDYWISDAPAYLLCEKSFRLWGADS